jgi:hypothetical protein
MSDELVPPGSRLYWFFLALLLVARASDFLSTWLATPSLVLEANPIAKRLGWRWGAVVNLVVCLLLACWPLPAIVLITLSLLVAARNFQSAWLARTLGERKYRTWIVERVAESNRLVFVFCLVAQSLLIGSVGAVLVAFSSQRLVPLAIGTGIIAYAFAVGFFSLLSVRRVWRQSSQVLRDPYVFSD